MSNDSHEASVIPILLPLHTVADGGTGRPRGRPKKVEPRPTRADLEYNAEVALRRLEHVEADEVVRAVADKDNATEVLQRVAEALAEDAAVLQHERIEQQKRGRDVGQLVSRRVETLNKLAALEIEIGRQVAGVLDLNSEAVQRLLKIWVDDVTRVAHEVLTPESFDVFVTRLEVAVADWEERAEALLR
jgi:hypothetical protein